MTKIQNQNHYYQKHDLWLKTHKKDAWKTLGNLETGEKPKWQTKNMVKLVLQHKQIGNVKSTNVEEFALHFQ